jgi:murein DD-endopeptidase MepM/ murein hydrolase activator NlpD
MQKSVSVAPGDRLAPGDPIARVGNSGNTTEPHLHVHAFDQGTGEGVPMTFDGREPVRNRVFRG